MQTLTNMKTFLVFGRYGFIDTHMDFNATREIKAENIARAIESFNSYNRKIYGADISEVKKVFELVWN